MLQLWNWWFSSPARSPLYHTRWQFQTIDLFIFHSYLIFTYLLFIFQYRYCFSLPFHTHTIIHINYFILVCFVLYMYHGKIYMSPCIYHCCICKVTTVLFLHKQKNAAGKKLHDDFCSSPPLSVCRRRPDSPTHWSGLLNAVEGLGDWHMDATLTAWLQIALIASLPFHRLSVWKTGGRGNQCSSSSPSAVTAMSSRLLPPCTQIYSRYIRGRYDLSNTLILFTPKTRLDVYSIMSLCIDLAWVISFSFRVLAWTNILRWCLINSLR